MVKTALGEKSNLTDTLHRLLTETQNKPSSNPINFQPEKKIYIENRDSPTDVRMYNYF